MVNTVAIAGSTTHTVSCAQALLDDPRFEISWILTPSPRKIGRKQEVTANPLDLFAQEHNIPVVHVEQKIERFEQPAPDFLLVVDFGYFIPDWLLELPHIAPVNIHPSELPKYRGSSPGQFALLFGEEKSAVSVIKMNSLLDQGDIIDQVIFDISSTFNTPTYYQFAFDLISKALPNMLADFATGKITVQPQPLESPTVVARRLTREDGFVSWELLQQLRHKTKPDNTHDTSELLVEARQHFSDWATTLDHALRALSPWPGLWTTISTKKGDKRMKILSVKKNGEFVELDQVQIEGYPPSEFKHIQTLLA